MDILYLVIPAYNEEENIRQVIEDWYPIVESHDGGGLSRLIIVDDGSKDSTFSIMQECAQNRPLFHPMHKENGGHGAAVLYGYGYALKKGADYIFQTDSDGQTLPGEFEEFWNRRRDYDMVIGSRGQRKDGLGRIVTTRVLRLVIRLCFHVYVQDANTPYRLMQADPLKDAMGLIPRNFFLSNVMVSVIFTKKGRRIKFLPITFRPRQGGVNSINMKRIFGIGKKALRDFRRMNRRIERDMRP